MPCDLREEFPSVSRFLNYVAMQTTTNQVVFDFIIQCFTDICDIWREVGIAATPFMRNQISSNHFEFFGIDIIADEFGKCWMVEANRYYYKNSSYS